MAGQTPQERYLSATMSSNLRLKADARCDADTLLAAAYAASGNPRKSLALSVYRLRAGHAGSQQALVEPMVGWLVRRSRPNRWASPTLHRLEARGVVLAALKWWRHPTCPVCEGRGHPLIAETPVIDLTRDCPECRGTGARSLERLVRREHAGRIRWLVSEMESLSSMVFSDMARRLSGRISG